MRDILFRGKCIETGKWVYGGILQTENWTSIYSCKDYMGSYYEPPYSDTEEYDVIPKTVGQYTGVKDKNGKRIFEGDVVKMRAYGGGFCKSVVYFKNGKFAVDGDRYNFKDICSRSVKVIGNIHDNPELLEVK